ncbi:thiol reductant ABC exporter subunit CydC [Isoptericola cucumis]|uniref:Thiol reductant ABC exporter subunit CydC n=1 Tax=Isoptericola cucumis TaxID=1776856 RepID=A0ABQ2B4F4_9MICO|nr:thiol reductant ABC exporter subunit CydC [Isoptericola cucumis]GGI06233.1 thiol reductant ABC exporter subunit CydC [Isoptericola cucumis]
MSSPDPLRRVLPLLEVRWSRVVRAVALGTLALGFAVGLSATAAWLIARASQMPPVLQLSVAVVAVRAFGTGRGVLRYLERLASHDVALRGMAALRANLYDALARGPVTRVIALRRGDLLARVGADVDAVGDVVVRALIPAGVAVCVGLGSVVLVGVFLPAAGLTLLGCLLLTGVLAPWLASRSAASVEARGAQARAEVTTRTLELLDDGQQLRVAGRTAERLGALRAADARLTRSTDDGARISGTSAAIDAGAQTLAVLCSLLLGIPAVAAGTLAPVELAVVVLTPLAVFEATSTLPAAAVQLRRSRVAAGRLVALLPGTPDGPAAAPAPDLAPEPAAGPAPEPGVLLSLRGATAGWPDRAVVAGVDVDLRAGSVVAVAGPSGVGKTTLLLTAAGLLPPRAGSVRGPARDTGALFVAEDGHLFGTTVLENLRVARADVSEDDARTALGAVGLDTWLAGLPDGLETLLGTDGADVSGGERRRLLVARALLAPAPVLLVDEPAEHLDATTADELVRTLAERTRATGRAVVVASHRLTPLGVADEVLLLGPGDAADGAALAPARVVARGTHAELLARDAGYAWSAAQEQAQERAEDQAEEQAAHPDPAG